MLLCNLSMMTVCVLCNYLMKTTILSTRECDSNRYKKRLTPLQLLCTMLFKVIVLLKFQMGSRVCKNYQKNFEKKLLPTYHLHSTSDIKNLIFPPKY